MHAQDLPILGVGDDLDKPLGVVQRQRFAVGAQRNLLTFTW